MQEKDQVKFQRSPKFSLGKLMKVNPKINSKKTIKLKIYRLAKYLIRLINSAIKRQ